MKFCDVVQFYSPLGGGVRRYLDDKIRYLAGKADVSHTVIVPSHRNAVDSALNSKMIEIKSLRLVGSLSYRMLLNRSRIMSVIDQERPDLIEVGDPYRSAWITLEAAQRHNIPVAAFYHSDFPRALGRTIRRFCSPPMERMLSNVVQRYIVNLYNRMSVTVVASRRLQRVLIECGIPRVVCIPLGTDVSVFCPNPDGMQLREELGLPPNARLLLYIGRLAREKNIRRLIDMMDVLNGDPSSEKTSRLLLVGDGELRGFVEKTISHRSDVIWRQYCKSREKLTAYYSAADLFVHAGNVETFGITSLEAQACGLRVLAVKGGGLDDTVAGESPCIMAASTSGVDLARGVLEAEAAEQPGDSERRRRRMIDSFSIQTTFDRLFALYRHILENRVVDEFRYSEDSCSENESQHPTVLTG
ncbi:MAG: glycosyltransferase [Candidatus Omnitrophica bacterium]|nr:glycosyltransferase [Candidatus Omnitrophota bacterium]